MLKLLLTIIAYFLVISNAFSYDIDELTLDVAVKLKSDFTDDIVSDLFATSHDLTKLAKVVELDNDGLFHFRIKEHDFNQEDMRPTQIGENNKHHRIKRHIEDKIEKIRNDDRVVYVEPQEYLNRQKRRDVKLANDDLEYLLNLIDDSDDQDGENELSLNSRDMESLWQDLINNKHSERLKKRINKNILHHFLSELEKSESQENSIHLKNLPSEIDFNDVDYGKQWYLINEGQMKIPANHDLNVRTAWMNGYSGKNISIVIIDDGIDHEHPDFEGKYRPDLSYDFNDESDDAHDPMPSTFDDNNSHGTKCAGAAAAKANNQECGVGVAYGADVGGIRILDGKITDLLEARSLLFKAKETDIKTLSWGPQDDGAHMEFPRKYVNQALEEGVKIGRKGKGTIYVWASGNGGKNNDDCSCDGYVSNWNAISIGSVNHRGLTPYYSELCPSTMAVAYTGGKSDYGKSENTDDPGVRVSTTDVRGKCVSDFQGTSAAAPIAAGVFALVLESNPNLGYRDVMHLIARTARVPNIEDMDGWIINGANYHVNEKYGFGVLDVAQMIQEAQKWNNVPAREKCTARTGERALLEAGQTVEIDILVEDECPENYFLEHVVANISFSYPVRGEVKLTLISPFGTTSEILSYRNNDKNADGIQNFPFMTVFNWGESPTGKWRLIAEPLGHKKSNTLRGEIGKFELNFFGFKIPADKLKTIKRSHSLSRAFIPSEDSLKKIYESEMSLKSGTSIVHKRLIDADPSLRSAMLKAEK